MTLNRPLPRVLLGMSGGVDSSVAVQLLKEGGYSVTGLTILTGSVPGHTIDKARSVANRLDIDLIIMDSSAEFEEAVIKPVIEGYSKGLTPNPCILCNPTFKFSVLLREADRQGIEFVATGHYANVANAGSEHLIARAGSAANDQSYFLYRLPEEMKSRLVLPLGGMSKADVRCCASDMGLDYGGVRSSQEACFTESGMRAWLKERLPGMFTQGPAYEAETGKLIGHHGGALGFTLGQRKGHGVAAGKRAYITRIETCKNAIYLGSLEGCMTDAVVARDCVITGFASKLLEKGPARLRVKVRSSMEPVEAEVALNGDQLSAKVKVPMLIPAPGQSLVCYYGDSVICGGIIADRNDAVIGRQVSLS